MASRWLSGSASQRDCSALTQRHGPGAVLFVLSMPEK